MTGDGKQIKSKQVLMQQGLIGATTYAESRGCGKLPDIVVVQGRLVGHGGELGEVPRHVRTNHIPPRRSWGSVQVHGPEDAQRRDRQL